MTKILIIDDDEVVPVSLQIALQSEGHDVEIATNADEGLARAARGEFDVVIADLHWDVPGTKRRESKGLGLIEQLHRAKPRLPIILMTAFPDTDTIIDATKFGALDYITKPGTDEEMDKLADRKPEDAPPRCHGLLPFLLFQAVAVASTLPTASA